MRGLSGRIALFLLVATAARPARTEDQQVRSRAVDILHKAQLASLLPAMLNITTEVSFSASSNGGGVETGTYRRIRGSNGDLRQDAVFPGFQASIIDTQEGMATSGPWEDAPLAVRLVKQFVPYTVLRFDATDVVQSIESNSSSGQPATCIEFVTVRGEDRNPGEICVSQADSTVIGWHDLRRSWTATAYTRVAGALIPSSFTYREGNTQVVNAEVKFTLLPSPPKEAFAVPNGWNKADYCSNFLRPVAQSTPQPSVTGSNEGPVLNVALHAHVMADGAVARAVVLKPVRADLNAEAVKTVSGWRFKPALCDGRAVEVPVDLMIHFQGR